MLSIRQLEEINSQPSAAAFKPSPCLTETLNTQQTGFWSEAVNSFKYSAAQSPLNGLAQLADYTEISDKVLGRKLLPRVHFMDAPQENNSWSGWLGQQIGGAAGLTLNFMLPSMVRGIGRLASGGTALARATETISAGEKIWAASKTGFAYDLLCKPVMPEEGDFWTSRLRNGVVGGLTFGTLTGSTLAAKYGLHNIADKCASILRLNTLLKNEIVKGGIAGIVSGAPAAVVSTYGHSVLTRGELPTDKEINSSVLSFMTAGGLLGTAHGLVDHAAATKKAPAEFNTSNKSDKTITANIQRELAPGVRRFRVVDGNAERLIESLQSDKTAQGRLVLRELSLDGSLGPALETHIQHFGPDCPIGLNEQAVKSTNMSIFCHPQESPNSTLQAKNIYPDFKGKISMVLDNTDVVNGRHQELLVGPEDAFANLKEISNKRKVTLSDAAWETSLGIKYDAFTKSARIESPSLNLQQLTKFLSSHGDLEQLTIERCPEVSNIPLEYTPKLRQLTIKYCYEIKDLPLHFTPQLQQLIVSRCEMPSLPLQHTPNLEHLAVKYCNWITELPLQYTPKLKYLHLYRSDGITKLPLQHTPNLEQLAIETMSFVEELPLQHTPKLRHLVADGSHVKVLALEHAPQLETVELNWCNDLRTLGERLPSKLEELTLVHCPALKDLPKKLPPTLKLTIDGCTLLDSNPDVQMMLEKHFAANASAAKWSLDNVRVTADLLKQSADAIYKFIPQNSTCVLLGRDAYPLVPLLRYRGIDARYFLWSRLQTYDPHELYHYETEQHSKIAAARKAAEEQNAKLWRQEVPPGSIVIDTGYGGSIFDSIKKSDPTIKGYLLSSNGRYPEIPGLKLDRLKLVEYVERFPKSIGRANKLSQAGVPVAKSSNRDAEEKVFLPQASVLLTEQLLQELGLPNEFAYRHKTFTGLTKEERLGIGKYFIPGEGIERDRILRNFDRVHSFLYRGGQPGDGGLQKLQGLGVDTIINLRTGSSVAREEQLAKSLGIRFIHLPIDGEIGIPTSQQMSTFMKEVMNASTRWSNALNDAEKPVKPAIYVHCARGSDRTGTLIAATRIGLEGWTFDQAYREMRKYSFNAKHTHLTDVLQQLSKTRNDSKAGKDILRQILYSAWRGRQE